MAEDQGKEEEKFDFTPEGEGYISLDEARILAVRTAVASPGDYGRDFRRVTMVFEVSSLEETDDFYEVTLSFRPQGDFDGTPGQEQFVVGKEGVISVRQVLSLPAQTLASPAGTASKVGGFPMLPVAIGVVIVGIIGALGAVFSLMGSGGESVPVAAVTPMGTQDSSETLAPTYTPRPTYSPAPTLTPSPTLSAPRHPPSSTSVPTPLPTATLYPTPTPYPTAASRPTSGAVFSLKWGTNGAGNGEFYRQTGVAVASDGSVYVTDRQNDRVQKFTSEGVFVSKWGTEGTGDGQFQNPNSVAVATDGSVYVADSWNHRIQKFTSTGAFVSQWGREGTGDGRFNEPQGVAVASDGSVYVADTLNHRIQKFTSEGVFVSKWGTFGAGMLILGIRPGDGKLHTPSGIAVASDGSVYVADTYNHRIQKFTSEGVFVNKWGTVEVDSTGKRGTNSTGDGQFDEPEGVAVASDGSVYVTDRGNYRIQKFTSGGAFVRKWGTLGSGDGQFGSPHGIAVASDGSVYVADGGNNRIQKFSVMP